MENGTILEIFTRKYVVLYFTLISTVILATTAVLMMFALYDLMDVFDLAEIPAGAAWSVGFPITVIISVPMISLTLYTIGRFIAALANAKVMYHRLSVLDPLSGLLNRRAFNDEFEAIRAQSCLMVFDADYFKSVNDKFGHDAGDKVIVTISSLLSKAFPAPDVVARLGGEEFGVIFRGGSGKKAILMANAVREELANTEIVCNDQVIRITVSVGLEDFSPDDHWEDVMRRADKALYRAKESGRNKVVHWREMQNERWHGAALRAVDAGRFSA